MRTPNLTSGKLINIPKFPALVTPWTHNGTKGFLQDTNL